MFSLSIRAHRHVRQFTEVFGDHTPSTLRGRRVAAATLVQDLTIELPANSKDHIIPYCADQRHPMDTLFFIAEEDWRLAQSHAAPGVDLTGLTDDLHMALETPESLLELEAVRFENRLFPRWQILRGLTANAAAGAP